MAINGSCVRDTVRVLKVGMVIHILKKSSVKTVNHSISTTEVWCGYNKPDRWVNMNQQGITKCPNKNKKFILRNLRNYQ